MYTKTFFDFTDEGLTSIRKLTNNIPLYISFLKKSRNELSEIGNLRNSISRNSDYINNSNASQSEILKRKKDIENDYLKLLE